jgi:hypothetical protein
MKRLNQSGSHVLAIVLFVAVLGVVGFAGYKVMNAGKAKPATTATTTTKADTIKNTADLTKAADQLDSSSTQVSTNLDDSSLNNDLNDML